MPTPLMWASAAGPILSEWQDSARAVSSNDLWILTPNSEPFRDVQGVHVMQDSDEYRGTAGVVRDAAVAADGLAETLIVCEGRRRPLVDLGEVLNSHFSRDLDVTVVGDGRGGYLGVTVIRRGVIAETVSRLGYQDLKEQWIEKITREGARVGMHRVEVPRFSMPLHSRDDLLRSAELTPRGVRRRGREGSAPRGGVVGKDAEVHETARIDNSIVFGGGRVAEGALVVRSVVGPGADVGPVQVVVDRVVTGREPHPARGRGSDARRQGRSR